MKNTLKNKLNKGGAIDPEGHIWGKCRIFPDRLINENKLKLKTAGGSVLPEFPVKTMSDNFVRFMTNVLKTDKVDGTEYNLLNTSEQHIFDRMVDQAKMARNIGHHIKKDDNGMLERLKILEGEVEAGNSNPQIRREAKVILNHLVKIGRVTRGDADSHYNQFK